MKQLVQRKLIRFVIPGLLGVFLVSLSIYYVAQMLQKPTSQPVVKFDTQRTLIFEDNFNGTTIDRDKWNTCYDNYSIMYGGCSNLGNDESEWYKAAQTKVKDGNLILTAQKKSIKGLNRAGHEHEYQYVSGMVSSGRFNKQASPKWGNSYGYYEARINIPDGKALWPAFWLVPTDLSWPPEIDVMEVLGDKPNELITTYFWKGADDSVPKDSSLYKNNESLAHTWHTYSIDWQPGKLDWYLDGKKIKHSEGENVPDTEMNIILNLAVGGNLPGDPDDSTPTSAKMLVDYVRVYR